MGLCCKFCCRYQIGREWMTLEPCKLYQDGRHVRVKSSGTPQGPDGHAARVKQTPRRTGRGGSLAKAVQLYTAPLNLRAAQSPRRQPLTGLPYLGNASICKTQPTPRGGSLKAHSGAPEPPTACKRPPLAARASALAQQAAARSPKKSPRHEAVADAGPDKPASHLTWGLPPSIPHPATLAPAPMRARPHRLHKSMVEYWRVPAVDESPRRLRMHVSTNDQHGQTGPAQAVHPGVPCIPQTGHRPAYCILAAGLVMQSQQLVQVAGVGHGPQSARAPAKAPETDDPMAPSTLHAATARAWPAYPNFAGRPQNLGCDTLLFVSASNVT